MTNASVVIFAEIFWNPGDIVQCEDRVHRIGQKKQVLIQFMVGDNPFENRLWEIIERKLMILGKSIDGIENNQLEFNEEKKVISDNENISQNIINYLKDFYPNVFEGHSSFSSSKSNLDSLNSQLENKNLNFDDSLGDSSIRSNMSLNEIDSIIEKHEKE